MAGKIAVALVRQLVVAQQNDVCIAIDVLRATTTLAVAFGRGCPGVWLANDVDQAQSYGRETGRLICGELGGLPPPGFDFGNSPLEFGRLDLTGRELVFATTNGTGTIRACADGARVFAGAFVNATAAVQSALRALDELGDPVGRLYIAAAGTRGHFGIEDAACAGFMVRTALRAHPEMTLDDSAVAALRLFDSFSGPLDAVLASEHARTLADLGMAEDAAFCGQLDVTGVVPELGLGSPWPMHLVE